MITKNSLLERDFVVGDQENQYEKFDRFGRQISVFVWDDSVTIKVDYLFEEISIVFPEKKFTLTQLDNLIEMYLV